MVFTAADHAIIETCFKAKGCFGRRICQEFKVYFWDAVKAQVYEGRREPFPTLDALQERIEEVWVGVVGNGATLRKAVAQFRPRLKAIVAQQGHSIKMHFA